MDKIVNEKDLKVMVVKKLVEVGLKADQSEIVADILLHADMRGVRSHGTMRLEHYCNRIKLGALIWMPNLNLKKPLQLRVYWMPKAAWAMLRPT